MEELVHTFQNISLGGKVAGVRGRPISLVSFASRKRIRYLTSCGRAGERTAQDEQERPQLEEQDGREQGHPECRDSARRMAPDAA